MTLLSFGSSFWQALDAPTKAGMSGSWATHPSLNANAATSPPLQGLALQAGTATGRDHGPPFGSAISDPTAIELRRLQHCETAGKFTREGTDTMFYSAQERLETLTVNEIGAFMAVIQLTGPEKDNDNVVKPFLTFLGLPSTALAGTPAVQSDEMLPTGGVLDMGDGCELTLPETFQPILTTTLRKTRDLKPGQIKEAFWKHADFSLLIIQGDKALAPLLIPEVRENKPTPGSDWEKFFVDNDTKQFIPEICKPTRFRPSDEESPNIAGFWYSAPMIPFGIDHNLPYGFVMDPATATSGTAIKQAIESFLGLPEDSTVYGFLETPYIDSWCRTMSKNPEAFAQQAVSLEQIRTSWMSIVTSPDPSSISIVL